jgi:hypothetical protein
LTHSLFMRYIFVCHEYSSIVKMTMTHFAQQQLLQ